MFTRCASLACPLVLAVVLAAGGCGGGPGKVDYARAYPKDAVQSEILNIQVVRQTTEIEFTNTTARAFGPCTMWLNARFSRPLDGLKIGETLRLPLREFRDEYGDAFRGGGFFATELPEKLVLAQLEVPVTAAQPEDGSAPASRWLGLIVIGGEE